MTSLFVKPSSEVANAEMKTSSAQVSHENLWATIFKSEEISYSETEFGKSVFEIDATENRTRKYLWHATTRPYVEYEYTIVGKGSTFANWTLSATRTTKKGLYN